MDTGIYKLYDILNLGISTMKWYIWALFADMYAVSRFFDTIGILPENAFFTAKVKMVFGIILLIAFFLLWLLGKARGESLAKKLRDSKPLTAMFVAAILLIYVEILIPVR